jgi:hypothetical protein
MTINLLSYKVDHKSIPSYRYTTMISRLNGILHDAFAFLTLLSCGAI